MAFDRTAGGAFVSCAEYPAKSSRITATLNALGSRTKRRIAFEFLRTRETNRPYAARRRFPPPWSIEETRGELCRKGRRRAKSRSHLTNGCVVGIVM